MNWLDRYVVAPIAPRMALHRAAARRALKAYYEADEESRLRKKPKDRRSGDAQNERANIGLRANARHLDQNFDIASGVLDILETNIVGRGVQPEPQVLLKDGEPATEFNSRLMRLHDLWSYEHDVTGQFHLYEGQRLMARSWIRDGDVFAQKLIGNVPGLTYGTVLPYALEYLEADFVPDDLNDASRRITQGIERNAWGRTIAFHVLKEHPGSTLSFKLEAKRVPAQSMVHLKLVKRFHQARGVTLFAPVLNRYGDIKEIDEAERIAAKVAASMAAYIKKASPDMYEPAVDENGQPRTRNMEFMAGIVFDDLQPGEEVGTIDTRRPNNALIPFRDAQLRAAAAGTKVSFSSSSKNYNGTYSAQRQELVEQWGMYQSLGSSFVYRVAQPVWDGFIDAVVASGAIEIPRNVDRETLYDCVHTGPSMVWIDPVSETEAQVTQLKWALKARSRIIRERGDNPDQVNREIERDRKERERLGIEFIDDKSTPAQTGRRTDLDKRKGRQGDSGTGDDNE